MRCKVGDLAIIVGPPHGDKWYSWADKYIGMVVKVVGPHPSDDTVSFGVQHWECSPALLNNFGRTTAWPDDGLRPIRGEPETQDKQLEATT